VIPADERAELARRYLAEVSATGVEQLPPTVLMREVAELRRLLGQVLAVLAERQDEARQLAEIRAVLAAFDWERDDRQYALETVERIVTGPAPQLDSELWTCRSCGGQFIGRRPADDRCRYCAGGAR
jgi:hypothetical protein